MKNKIFLLSVLLILIYCIPITSFAAEESPTYPNAVFTITNSKGTEIKLQYDYFRNEFRNFPSNGDRVNIYYSGNTNKEPDSVFIYDSIKKDYYDGEKRFLEISVEPDYKASEIKVCIAKKKIPRLADSPYLFKIYKKIKTVPHRAPLKSIEFSPAQLIAYTEDTKDKSAGGSITYNFAKRTVHISPGGNKWESPFAAGEILNVRLVNGETIPYVNADIFTTQGYKDYFISKDGDKLMLQIDNAKLTVGNNTVVVFLGKYPEIKTAIKVLLKTEKQENDNNISDNRSDKKDNTYNPESVSESEKSKIVVPKAKSVKVSKSNRKITVSWKKLTKAQRKKVDKIEVQYSTGKTFPKSKTKIKYADNTKKSLMTTKIRKNRTYYIRVRNIKYSNGRKKASKWSAIKRIRI